jgi:hypothetical protein
LKKAKSLKAKHPASFRDPKAFVFTHNNNFCRHLSKSYQSDYDMLMDSGLYDLLVKKNLLIKHEELDKSLSPQSEDCYKVLGYKSLDFVSYPYEWCFGQLQEAAIKTLTIQETALKKDMSLKDASAYNMQWQGGKFKLIDTSSLQKHVEGEPWVAYHQFCTHFLAPLVLMSYTDLRLNKLLRSYIDGIPLDLAVKMLPFSAKLSFGNILHLFMHASMVKKYEDVAQSNSKMKNKVSKTNILAMCDSLKSLIKKLKPNNQKTEWGDYYSNTNYLDSATSHKREIVSALIAKASPLVTWDLGANNGEYSRLSVNKDIFVLSADIDPMAVEKNYRQCIKEGNESLLPLCVDITNPSPSIGWHNDERENIFQRANADLVMALALVHHLAISNNVPFNKIVDFFADITSNSLIIEFIPKEDSQVKRLLTTREDIFPNYTQKDFEDAFEEKFEIIDVRLVKESKRICYLMKLRK